MPNKTTRFTTENLFLIGYTLGIWGMVFSRAGLSIGMVVVIAASLLQGNLRQRLVNYCTNPIVLAYLAFFALVTISGLYSENVPAFMERLRIKLPFLLLPIAVLSAKPISEKGYHSVLYFFFLMMVGIGIYQCVYLTTHYEQVLQMYATAGVIPAWISHIQLSIMIAMASVTGAYLYLKNMHWVHPSEKYGIATGTLFLFIFLHIDAVRSGLLAIYLVILVLSIRYVVSTKKYWLGLLMVAILAVVPIAAFYTIPTLQNKFYYMRHDLIRFANGEFEGQYSDTRRLMSMQIGVKAGNTSPLIGVGYGDIENTTKAIYTQQYPTVQAGDYLTPHNQFVYVYAGIGFIGLLSFLIAIFIPVFYKHAYRDPLLLAVNIMLISSFLTEHTLEVQIGVALYLLFLLLAWKRWESSVLMS